MTSQTPSIKGEEKVVLSAEVSEKGLKHGYSEWNWPLVCTWSNHRKPRPGSLEVGVDDVNKLGLEGSSAHEEAIDVFLGGQLLAGAAGHGA